MKTTDISTFKYSWEMWERILKSVRMKENLLFFDPWSRNSCITGRSWTRWCTWFRKTTTNFTRFEKCLHFCSKLNFIQRKTIGTMLLRSLDYEYVWIFWRLLCCAVTKFDISVNSLTVSITQKKWIYLNVSFRTKYFGINLICGNYIEIRGKDMFY